jgi:hypothetical protein
VVKKERIKLNEFLKGVTLLAEETGREIGLALKGEMGK